MCLKCHFSPSNNHGNELQHRQITSLRYFIFTFHRNTCRNSRNSCTEWAAVDKHSPPIPFGCLWTDYQTRGFFLTFKRTFAVWFQSQMSLRHQQEQQWKAAECVCVYVCRGQRGNCVEAPAILRGTKTTRFLNSSGHQRIQGQKSQ